MSTPSPPPPPLMFDISMISPQKLSTYITDPNLTTSMQQVFTCGQTSVQTTGTGIPVSDPCVNAVRSFCSNTNTNPFKADIAGSDFCSCSQADCSLTTYKPCMNAQATNSAYLDESILSQNTNSECTGNACINSIIVNGSDNILTDIIQTCDANYTIIFKLIVLYRIQTIIFFIVFLTFIILVRMYNNRSSKLNCVCPIKSN